MISTEISAVAACVSAIVAAFSAYFSFRNSLAYYKALRNQRTDDCVSAAYGFKGAVGKAMENKYAKDIRKRANRCVEHRVCTHNKAFQPA